MLTVLRTALATEDTIFGVHLGFGLDLRHLNAISSERGGKGGVFPYVNGVAKFSFLLSDDRWFSTTKQCFSNAAIEVEVLIREASRRTGVLE